MNCTECRELLTPGLQGLLNESRTQIVKDHLRTCDACRAELKELKRLHVRLVSDGKTFLDRDMKGEVMNRILREQNARLKTPSKPGTEADRRAKPATRSIRVRLMIAAAILLACGGALFIWSGTNSTVALADVLGKVEQVGAFSFKMTFRMKGTALGFALPETDTDASMLFADEYGMRMDVQSTDPNNQRMSHQMYVLPARKQMVMVMPELKQYARMEMDDTMFEEERRENNDPRLMLQDVLKCKYTDLGRSTIDGVEVQGFQTTDPAYTGDPGDVVDVKIWVDAKTELPVRMDTKIKTKEQGEMEDSLHDFRWNVPVSAADFEPVIPADFTAGPGDGLKMPAMNEETAVAGLRLCQELYGKYPDDLNVMTLIQLETQLETEQFKSELSTIIQRPPELPGPGASEAEMEKWRAEMAKWSEDQQKRSEDQEKSLEEMKKRMMDDVQSQMNKMMPIESLGIFYAMLADEQKEPTYYGKVVKPGDATQVLLRWKTAENEYRVIFGDLHAATVNADTLAKLEASVPK